MNENWKQEELKEFNEFRNVLERQVYLKLLGRLEDALAFFEMGDYETAYRDAGAFVVILEQLQKEGYDLDSFSKITKEIKKDIEEQDANHQMS